VPLLVSRSFGLSFQDGHHVVHRELRHHQPSSISLLPGCRSARGKPLLVAVGSSRCRCRFSSSTPLMVWIDAANILLGVIRRWLVDDGDHESGSRRPETRGLALGLNEFADTSPLASCRGPPAISRSLRLRPHPFYLGIAIAVIGLDTFAVLVPETLAHVQLEARGQPRIRRDARPRLLRHDNRQRESLAACQAAW